MKKAALVFTAILTLSCAVPNEIKLNELDEDFSCLSPKDEMYINMDFDRCPLLSETPSPKAYYWELFRLGDFRNKENLSTNSIIERTKDCTKGAESSQQYLIGHDAKLLVDSIVIRTDSVAANRLFIYGRVVHNSREFKWIFVSNSNSDLNVTQRVKNNFKICQL